MAEEEVDIDLTDPEVGKAANKIGAAFKARKNRMAPKATPKIEEAKKPEKEEKEETNKEKNAEAEEPIDIDLEDPEVNEAAKKMQACFKARKKTV